MSQITFYLNPQLYLKIYQSPHSLYLKAKVFYESNEILLTNSLFLQNLIMKSGSTWNLLH